MTLIVYYMGWKLLKNQDDRFGVIIFQVSEGPDTDDESRDDHQESK